MSYPKLLFRIKVNSETSPLIQELLFSYDYHWNGNNENNVSFVTEPYLCIHSNKKILYSDDKSDDSLEATFIELLEFLKTGSLPIKKYKVQECDIILDYDSVKLSVMGEHRLTLSKKSLLEIVKFMGGK